MSFGTIRRRMILGTGRGLVNQVPFPAKKDRIGQGDGRIECRERLGRVEGWRGRERKRRRGRTRRSEALSTVSSPRLVEPDMQISRIRLSWPVRIKGYEAYRVVCAFGSSR